MDLDPPITPFSYIPFPSSTFCLALSFALTGELDSTFEGFANFGTEQESEKNEKIIIKIKLFSCEKDINFLKFIFYKVLCLYLINIYTNFCCKNTTIKKIFVKI